MNGARQSIGITGKKLSRFVGFRLRDAEIVISQRLLKGLAIQQVKRFNLAD